MSIHPSFHFFIVSFAHPPPIYQKAKYKRELFPTLCYAPLGLYNFFGQKSQEEGKDLEASIELYLKKMVKAMKCVLSPLPLFRAAPPLLSHFLAQNFLVVSFQNFLSTYYVPASVQVACTPLKRECAFCCIPGLRFPSQICLSFPCISFHYAQ